MLVGKEKKRSAASRGTGKGERRGKRGCPVFEEEEDPVVLK